MISGVFRDKNNYQYTSMIQDGFNYTNLYEVVLHYNQLENSNYSWYRKDEQHNKKI